jgi:hypothetical protein
MMGARDAISTVFSLAVALGLMSVAPAAQAHPDKSDVLMYGKVDCAVPGSNRQEWEPPTRVRFQTALGEGVDATLGSVPPGHAEATPFDYTAQFYNIPEIGPDGKNGVAYSVYVTCRDAPQPTWGISFRIYQKGEPHQYYSPLRGYDMTP